jgi:hypothetical protein
MGITNCVANGFADMELGRGSKRGKCIGQIVKYWYQIICLDIEDLENNVMNGRNVTDV